MSEQEAERLLNDLTKDDALRETFRQAGNSGFESAARQAGYTVTREEFTEVVRRHITARRLFTHDNFSITSDTISTNIIILL